MIQRSSCKRTLSTPEDYGITEAQLKADKPGGQVLELLRTHARSRGRALAATILAREVGCRTHGGANLQYALLAKRIGEQLGRPAERLSLLVDFLEPRAVTNREWVLVMKPEFAAALQNAGWIQ